MDEQDVQWQNVMSCKRIAESCNDDEHECDELEPNRSVLRLSSQTPPHPARYSATNPGRTGDNQ